MENGYEKKISRLVEWERDDERIRHTLLFYREILSTTIAILEDLKQALAKRTWFKINNPQPELVQELSPYPKFPRPMSEGYCLSAPRETIKSSLNSLRNLKENMPKRKKAELVQYLGMTKAAMFCFTEDSV